MKNPRRVLALAAGLFVSLAIRAAEPVVTTQFVVEDLKTHNLTRVTSAHMDEYVCIRVSGLLTPDGDHSFQLTIYDGLGRETFSTRSTITAENLQWGKRACFGFNTLRDAPGTWWYVGELDGDPLFSESIVILPARQ